MTFRFLIELAQKNKYLREISFRWKIGDFDASKEMLMCLPQTIGYNIQVVSCDLFQFSALIVVFAYVYF